MSIPNYANVQSESYFAQAAEGFKHEDWTSHTNEKFVLGLQVLPADHPTPARLLASTYEYGDFREEVPLTLEDVLALRTFLDAFINEASL